MLRYPVDRLAKAEGLQMKKKLICVASLTLAAGLLAGCSQQESKVEVPNPMVEVDGSEAFEKVGAQIEVPAGAVDAKFFIINDEIAEIQFHFHDAEYSYRASSLAEDISGVYLEMDGDKRLSVSTTGRNLPVETTTEGGRLAEWEWEPVSYSLYTADEVEDDEISSLVKELVTDTANVVTE